MRKRTNKINIFLDEDEKNIFENKVRKSGLNKSEFFRKIILDYKLKELLAIKYKCTKKAK